MGKISCLVVGVILIGNMFYTSGLAFRASGREVPDTPDMPYSPMLEELYGDFTPSDRACAEWLISQSKQNIPVMGDYNAQCLLMGYDYDRQRVDCDYKYPHYLFLTEQNNKVGQMVYGRSPGLRFYRPIPELSQYALVIAYNNSKIYIKE